MGSLGQLEELYVQYNDLKGSTFVPVLNISSLINLTLYGNNMSGSLLDNICEHLPSIRQFNLGRNQLDGLIPSKLWQCKELRDIVMDYNNFSGSIPKSLGNLTHLTKIFLNNNNLAGTIPDEICDLPWLEILTLQFNNLSGVIPFKLFNNSMMRILGLSINQLSGNLPANIGFNVPNLEFFYVAQNNLVAGPLPNFSNASKLNKKRNVEVVRETATLHQVLWRRVSRLELVKATNGFHESNLLGTGGFGSVYKGTLSDRIDIAVKVFNLQLEGAFKSFDKECEMLSNIRHQNLIKIISCCDELDFKALILQLMPNGSLENWLYSLNRSMTILQRLDIMKDVALALEYLHHGYSIPIVHCDVKPSNILLDDDMVTHVADFGIARLIGDGDSMTETVTLAIVGYMAPEFGIEGIISTSGDVYSFGIVLMETFTKRKPTDEMFVGEMNLKQWIADSLFLDAAIDEVVDANILGTEEDGDFVSRRDCLSSVLRLALACTAALPGERINMKDAAITLTKIKTKYLKDCERVNS
ncbi:unnamed protein product [Malus baccata var. baccata]